MDEITIELPKDMQRLCRTCMSLLDDTIANEQSLLEEEKLTNTGEIFTTLTNLKASKNDGLPETLCTTCTSQLQLFNLFKEQCITVEEHLRKLSNDTYEEKESEDSNMKDLEELMSEDLQYICLICNQTFATMQILKEHSLEHERNKTLTDKFHDAQIVEEKFAIPEFNEENLQLVSERKNAIFGKIQPNPQQFSNDSIYIYPLNTPVRKKKICDKSTSRNVKKVDKQKVIEQKENTKETISPKICPICKYILPINAEDSHNCAEVIANEEHKSTSKVCNICDRSFGDDMALSLHFLKHSLLASSEIDPKIITQFVFCDICGLNLESSEDLAAHVSSDHPDNKVKIWDCGKCCLSFESELDMLLHDQEIGHDKDDIWDEFLNREIVRDSYNCSLCKDSFESRDLLSKHSVVHAMTTVNCRQCKKPFCTSASYNQHMRSHPQYKHVCNHCSKVLSSRAALATHILGVHSSESAFICSTCGKGFKTRHRLHNHKNTHSEEKRLICSFCGYSTNNGGDLKVHVRIHTEERPYKCSYVNCGRFFKTSSHLHEHIRRHMKIKRFCCTICPNRFGQLSTLKIHMRTHTGEKPFLCTFCNVSFRRKHHLKNHMKQHETK